MVVGVYCNVEGYHLIHHNQGMRNYEVSEIPPKMKAPVAIPVYINASKKKNKGRSVSCVGRLRCEITSNVDLENRQSMMSWPIAPQRRSAIYGRISLSVM
jgi:hypothetical protein